ncbi:hypothetical protein DFJ73DRAFT_784509 [Zopfochytrium polystomum]|nr:hypothetical protein DFJ73DRAFT_784509 [Zopfochytrium polystomum]
MHDIGLQKTVAVQGTNSPQSYVRLLYHHLLYHQLLFHVNFVLTMFLGFGQNYHMGAVLVWAAVEA